MRTARDFAHHLTRVLYVAHQVDDGQLPGPAGLLQRAMERGLTISSLSDLVPGSRPRTSAGGSGTGDSKDPDFDSPAWLSAVGSMAADGCEGTNQLNDQPSGMPP